MAQTATDPHHQSMQHMQDPMTLPWGHPIQHKNEHTIQLLLQNIRGIDLTTTGSIKLVALRTFTQAMQASGHLHANGMQHQLE